MTLDTNHSGKTTLRDDPPSLSDNDSLFFAKTLQTIILATRSQHGDAYFRTLVRELARALRVRYAFVGEIVDADHGVIHTRAFWTEPSRNKNFEYVLKDTPCEQTIMQHMCFVPDNVPQHFPKDHLLTELGVESYSGVALTDRDEEQVGVLAFMDISPLTVSEPLVHNLLTILAERTTHEIECLRRSELLASIETRYRELAEMVPVGIFEVDSSGYITFVNSVALKLSGYTDEDFRSGINVLDLIATEHHALVVANLERAMAGERLNPSNYPLRRKDNSEVTITVRSIPIEEGGVVVGVRGIALPAHLWDDSVLKELWTLH